jgi:hypothetical protein
MMTEQSTLDKAATPRRLEIMNNESESTYALLVRSEEKGRGMMEMVVYALCVLSAIATIWQFIGQPTSDPFAGWDSAAQPTPVVSHHEADLRFANKS